MGNVDSRVMDDLAEYNSFFGEKAQDVDAEFTNLLVSWHVQNIAQYDEDGEEDDAFDPLDETDERFKDILEDYLSGGA